MSFVERGYGKRAVGGVVAALMAVGLVVSPASADMTIDFDFAQVIFGPVGSITDLAETTVDAEFVGETCLMAAVAENQSSVHPGNDLIVSTGDSQAVILGVEDTANGGTTERYAITMGTNIVVQLRFGEHAMSSLGFTLDFDCVTPIEDAGPVTTIVPATTVPPSTSTTSTSTTVATTTSVAPVTSAAAVVTTTACDESTLTSTDAGGGSSVTAAAGTSDGCSPSILCSDGSVLSSANATEDDCPSTTTVVATNLVCPDGATPVLLEGATEVSCPPVAPAVTDLPETPTATPVVAAPAYTG